MSNAIQKATSGLCAPQGYRASGVAADIKGNGADKLDCALVFSETRATLTGMFTTNTVKAPPVSWDEAVRTRGTAQAIFVNSGNANACTGARGIHDVEATAAHVASKLGVAVEDVCIASTGVIGVFLPMDAILAGVDGCTDALSTEGSGNAALAIMTTDTVPKETAVEVQLSEGAVCIGAIAKGSGMISPNMATMISLLTTDALISVEHLQPLLQQCVEASFNQICIDNDMSTSDTVLCLANGASGTAALTPGTEDFGLFSEALQSVCTEMAQALVRDGEGASKFIEIVVEGADSDDAAKTIARSIAVSQLCKTAFFGQDPNWGRIACAAGYADASFNPNDLDIRIGGVTVLTGGLPTEYREEDAAAQMQSKDIQIHLSVGDGTGRATFWTSDLSHDYVTINADYRT